MLNQLFSSVFAQSELAIDPMKVVLSLLISLALGLLLAGLYKYKTFYSKEFVLTLTVLPSLIAVIIFLVNGNLGTSVAVAGTFSLIKFRSPASSSKELLLVFMATAIGLATGMGYLALAVLVSLFIGGLLLLLENSAFAAVSATRRQLKLTLPRELAYTSQMEQLLAESCRMAELVSLTSKANQLELVYHIELKSTDSFLVTRLLSYDERIAVTLTKSGQKKKSL